MSACPHCLTARSRVRSGTSASGKPRYRWQCYLCRARRKRERLARPAPVPLADDEPVDPYLLVEEGLHAWRATRRREAL